MEKKIKLYLFIKIAVFFLLTWKYQYCNDLSIFTEYIEIDYNVDTKLDRRCYRLLGKCKRDNYSNIVGLTEEISNNGAYKSIDLYNNEKGNPGKKKHINGTSKYEEGHKVTVKNKTCIFETNKYSHLEKIIFKELDYMDFLKKNRTISEKVYKKIICKKCRLRFALPLLLLLLLLISLILDFTSTFGPLHILLNGLKNYLSKDLFYNLNSTLWHSPLRWISYSKRTVNNGKKIMSGVLGNLLGIIIYILPLILLGTSIIFGIIYYHKKVKKFEKIKFRKR
ncbi:fam-l protein [Plasmodium brasilianum]|uniref:Fam-l protein n=2 Tax=Plasmodium (Plasmodium) TaxID=418103 RepID=A0A1D3RJK4_PLAMA|nr:fam-l protein [Plasmodium malariae]KAI4838040.1 fam-l protein [Plasmodium brasilianum]SCN45350.1 fam-l protein [Plasmodium malariae]